jgi:hypothetical protein
MINDAQLSFAERNINRTNRAEKCAVEYFDKNKLKYVRYGFDEKNRRIESAIWWNLPEVVRSSPDFIVSNDSTVFVEAKGYRGDLKIKVNDLIAYEHWNMIMPLWLYIRNFDTSEEQMIDFKNMKKKIYECETGQYQDNGKTYFIYR